MSSPVGLVYNPLSHRISYRGAVLQAASIALTHKHTVRLENFGTLEQQMTSFAKAGVRTILIEGGDGTAQAVITECLSGRVGFASAPSFALIPGGMTNLAAKTIGLKKWGVKHIIRRIKQLEAGEACRSSFHPLLSIRSTSGGEARLGFFLSTGAAPRAIKYCRAKLHTRGAAGSIAVGLTLLRLLVDQNVKDEQGVPLLQPSQLSFLTSQTRKSGDHLFTMATTLPRLNLGLNPFWGMGGGGVRFTHAAWPVKGIARVALTILLGKAGPRLEKRGLISVNSDKIEVTHDGEFVLDGEFLQNQPDKTYLVERTPEIRFFR